MPGFYHNPCKATDRWAGRDLPLHHCQLPPDARQLPFQGATVGGWRATPCAVNPIGARLPAISTVGASTNDSS